MKPIFEYRKDGTKTVVNLLRFNQANSIREEVRALEATLSSGIKLEDRGLMQRQVGSLKKQLHDSCPEPLTPLERDANAIAIKDLETKFLPGMPTVEEMRRNPAHVVHNNLQWSKAYKEDVLEWKNRMLQQNPESDDADLCNIEGLRPSRPMTAGYDTTAQIPGYHAVASTEVAKANLQEALPNSPTASTALGQVQEAKENGKRQGTPNQLAHWAKIKADAKVRRDAKAAHATEAAMAGG